MAVYYETICPDGIAFIRDHLYPTWLKRRDEMEVQLVPYGKASVHADSLYLELRL